MTSRLARRQLLVSIHDVMPATLEQTETILDELRRNSIDKVTLLVVPDTGWDAPGLAKLRSFVDAGAELAGHGWRHKVEAIRSLKHRLHSLALSRDVAEHLALDAPGIAALIRRCYEWFEVNGLPRPGLYVPPAWALGPIPREMLDELPFARYETFAGTYCCQSGRFFPSAMVGFEADTLLRSIVVRSWNALNLLLAGQHRPVRLGIHPGDMELRLAGSLRRLLRQGGITYYYRELPSAATPEGHATVTRP